jgi:hypothetical protein
MHCRAMGGRARALPAAGPQPSPFSIRRVAGRRSWHRWSPSRDIALRYPAGQCMAHAGRSVIGFHKPQSLRNLLRRPAPVDQLALHKVMKPTATDQLATSSASLAVGPISLPTTLRAIRLGRFFLRAATQQFPPDRRSATPQQQANRPKARPAQMLRQNHATFLAVRCLYRLSIGTSYALRALGVALEI